MQVLVASLDSPPPEGQTHDTHSDVPPTSQVHEVQTRTLAVCSHPSPCGCCGQSCRNGLHSSVFLTLHVQFLRRARCMCPNTRPESDCPSPPVTCPSTARPRLPSGSVQQPARLVPVQALSRSVGPFDSRRPITSLSCQSPVPSHPERRPVGPGFLSNLISRCSPFT